jgi:hypothetical protein
VCLSLVFCVDNKQTLFKVKKSETEALIPGMFNNTTHNSVTSGYLVLKFEAQIHVTIFFLKYLTFFRILK